MPSRCEGGNGDPAPLEDAYVAWRDEVVALRNLTQRQLDAIAADPAGSSVWEILRQKRDGYRQAESAAQMVLAMRNGAGEASWALMSGIRGEIEAALTDLASLEARSRDLLNNRIRLGQAELNLVHRGRLAARLYGQRGTRAAQFLDQRR